MKNRVLLAVLTFVFGHHLLWAGITSTKTYRIVSVSNPEKSLIVKNSSLDRDIDVVLWAETDVPSQQWTIAGTVPTSTVFRNVYSKLSMGVSSTSKNGMARQLGAGGSGIRWVMEPVDEDANIYKFKQSSSGLYLTLLDSSDGSIPQLSEAEDNVRQQWKFVEVEPKSEFTTVMREEMIDAYIQKAVETKGTNRKTFINGSWGESEQLEVVLDAYETTGKEDYLKLAKDVYNWFNANVGSSWNKLVYTNDYHWYGHDFNDDVMWQIIAVARLGLLADNSRYVQAAKQNFDKIYERAYIPFTGLMRWAESSGDPYGTNSCIAGPTEVAACYLGFAGCGEEYFEKARDLYAAQRYTLTNSMSTGKVWDNVVWDPDAQKVKSKNEWGSTYNQGTMLGAACMLYKHYGDEQYLSDAKKIMQWTKTNLCDSHNIINVCQGGDNGDLYGFKGILMRYVRRFVRDCNQTSYQTWLEKNAMHAYCNRNTEGVTPTAWLQKGTIENTTDDFGNSTAASAAANVMFPDDPPLPYEEESQEDVIRRPTTNEAKDESSIEYYDLTGRRLSNLDMRGIYIMRCGQQASLIRAR